jgi:AraC-like DNA-binding protein/mannose-6-phosphate isomerase-like protein (cupin superfamily)
MGIKQLNIYENQLEDREYARNDSFPFRIGYEEITNYVGATFQCHWHPELEFAYIKSGSMIYQVNNNQYLVRAGDAMFVNQNCLHSGTSYRSLNCEYFGMTFLPVLLSGHKNSIFESKYLAELVTSERVPFAYFNGMDNENKHIISALLELEKVYTEKVDGYELLIQSKLFELIFHLYKDVYCELPKESLKNHKNVIQIKAGLDYIHAHYKENITLADIAYVSNLSKSSCCRLFKKIVHETPFNYLLKYRIQKSIPYLLNDGLNITETAILMGFSNSSYFTEIFHRLLGMTPSEYKKKYLSNE